jgi:hypothetical protein
MNRKLAPLGACGATPTASPVPDSRQASTAQADTSSGRVPNLFASGN